MSQVWLVTGSSRGLGRALATAVLAAGHQLVATARNPADLDDLVAAYGDRVRAVALDVTDSEAAKAAVATAVSAFGRLDVVVNNAGYANLASIEDLPEADFRAQMETNFFGVVNVSRAALPVLRAQRSGHIIQISSIGGRMASPGLGAYQAAKWAVNGFSGVLHAEVKPFGVKVTTIEPGGFKTDWAGSSMRVDEPRAEYKETISLNRGDDHIMRGDPAKAAQVILQVAVMDAPPDRLLLGADAVFLARIVAAARAEADATYAELSASTDLDGIPAIEDSPLGKMFSSR